MYLQFEGDRPMVEELGGGGGGSGLQRVTPWRDTALVSMA
jgi:hypothetical protein